MHAVDRQLCSACAASDLDACLCETACVRGCVQQFGATHEMVMATTEKRIHTRPHPNQYTTVCHNTYLALSNRQRVRTWARRAAGRGVSIKMIFDLHSGR
jgi:hypothetical protein